MTENNSTNSTSVKDKFKKVGNKLMENEHIKAFVSNKSLMLLTAFVIATLVIICVNTFALSVPVVAVCSIVILEIVLLKLLDGSPIYLHAVVFALQLAMGFAFHKVVFMLLNALLYIAGIMLFVLSRNTKRA